MTEISEKRHAVTGGAFAALASLRASQLVARAPLGSVLVKISNSIVSMNVAKKLSYGARYR
jgi:hypothetical protein